jgi:spermidine synthase
MPTSLFIEHHANGLAFYINGDLQFDTADEAIYHESLVAPPIALAAQRFPHTPLQVLICGGGDGLALRDVLRWPQVAQVTLVDYSPEVLELGRTVFVPYNQGSLVTEVSPDQNPDREPDRVCVHTQEAFEFVSALPAAHYHAVICDFTFPTCAAETQVYSREWFQQVARVLVTNGVTSTNGVSIAQRTLGFWCLYQTLRSAGLDAKPMQVNIPSFQHHGYGDWGFFLASTSAIARTELESLTFPPGLTALSDSWLQGFQIRHDLADRRHTVPIHSLDSPQLLYHLLNPGLPLPPPESSRWVDFLDLHDTSTPIIGGQDLLELDAIVDLWLDQLHQSDPPSLSPAELLPVQHRYHTPKMTEEGLSYARSLLGEVDSDRLLSALLARAKELPPKLAQDLRQLRENLRSNPPLASISIHTNELMIMLMVTLLVASTTAPDAVFAKGSSGSSTTYIDANGNVVPKGSSFGWLGFWTMTIGGLWLWNLYTRRDR